MIDSADVSAQPPPWLIALRCPVCARSFEIAPTGSGRAIRCGSGHSYDIARHGYIHLSHGPANIQGDTATMIDARARFLADGHYAFLTASIAEHVARWHDTHAIDVPIIADAGAGNAHYLAHVLDALPAACGIALDVSKAALRRAARAHARAGAVYADVRTQIPLADQSVSALLDVFAPRNAIEFRRVLRDNGVLLVATPDAKHLNELTVALGLVGIDTHKDARLTASIDRQFEQVQTYALHRTLVLSHAQVRTLVAMGPSARHIDNDTREERLSQLPSPISITAAVRLTLYRPRLVGAYPQETEGNDDGDATV